MQHNNGGHGGDGTTALHVAFFRLTDHSDVFRVAISVVARFMIFVKVTLS